MARKRPQVSPDTVTTRPVEPVEPVEVVEVVGDAVRDDPDCGPTCVYKAGESKVLAGVDVAAAYRDGWHDVPTDHPDSRE